MISVVTLNRDRPDIYRNHLISLQNQKMPDREPWELIILDDSTEGNDGQEEAIKEVCSIGMPCDVKAFRSLNRIELGGEGKVINFGVKQTKGDPIFVICGDDIFPSHHFFLMNRVRERMIAGGREKFVLGWPLYHVKPDISHIPLTGTATWPSLIPYVGKQNSKFCFPTKQLGHSCRVGNQNVSLHRATIGPQDSLR